MNTIESPPPTSIAAALAIDPDQLPELSAFDRLALRFSLALITRIEQDVARERARRARAEQLARTGRAQGGQRTECLLPFNVPWR
ncbi:MAG TPA: hypothetical protein VGC45_06345 [Gryllotalpicola sp.]